MNLVKMRDGRLDYLWLGLIVLAGAGLRLAAIAAFNHSPESDELAYRSMAINLVNGRGIVDSMGNHAMYNVGYPLFVLAPAFVMFGENILAARLLNVILGVLTVVLCYATAKEAGAGRIGRLLAAASWALYLPSSVYAVYLCKENLMAPLMLGIFWCALRLGRKPDLQTAVGCGALFGLIALTGNAALSLAGPVVLALFLARATNGQRLTSFVLILCVATAVTAPWIVRNIRVIGSPVLNTNGGFNLYLGNNPAATGWYISIGDTPRGPTWGALRNTGEVAASDALKADAVEWIKDHPSQFVALALRKAAYFWTPPFHDGKGKTSAAEVIVRRIWAIEFLLLIAAAVESWTVKSLRGQQLAILWFGIVCYTAVHMLFYVIFRYREPIMPAVCVIAGMTIEALFLQWRAINTMQNA